MLPVSECMGKLGAGSLCILEALTKNSMEQSHSREADSSSASQEITHILWILEFHYCSDKSPPLVPVLS